MPASTASADRDVARCIGGHPRRPTAEPGVPVVRDRLSRAGLIDFDELSDWLGTRSAGLLLAILDLVALDLSRVDTAIAFCRSAGFPKRVCPYNTNNM
jgi:hypothetical protein